VWTREIFQPILRSPNQDTALKKQHDRLQRRTRGQIHTNSTRPAVPFRDLELHGNATALAHRHSDANILTHGRAYAYAITISVP
jgi:hypothetical protein